MQAVRPENQQVISLEAYEREVSAITGRAHDLVDDLEASAFNAAPRPGAWSIGQCLQHLAATHGEYEAPLQRALSKARRSGKAMGRSGFGQRFGWFERWFISQLEPPPKRRFPAPKQVRPAAVLDMDATVQGYFDRLDGSLELRRQADGLDLCRVRIGSPFAKWMRLGVGAAFAVLMAHDRRHLWQAEQSMLKRLSAD